MIAYIEGRLSYKSPAVVYLENNGVGYEILISLHTYTQLQHLERCRLLTFLHIKEDAHTLYGFFEESERQVFLQLLSVSGVGASTARMILSSMQPEEIQAAILQENEGVLERVKGIGAKTAKRIILELRDKVLKQKEIPHMPASARSTLQADALQALLALGIARSAAESAVQKAMKASPGMQQVEELIKLSLKSM
ncbi:Holliday junction branch migration protein RuvA [Compostibacter hankyongensis]|uniref:Holliday junction branch migration complex subunit RuvA n=1 Tax=Compostibacter hankyongensis TaxID=1007089 RepID=A0ABP8FFD7_9BACT